MRVFGSRARGDAREDFDLDLFVLLDTDDTGLKKAVLHSAFDIGLERDLPFTLEPLVMSRPHFENLVRLERLIASEGIPV